MTFSGSSSLHEKSPFCRTTMYYLYFPQRLQSIFLEIYFKEFDYTQYLVSLQITRCPRMTFFAAQICILQQVLVFCGFEQCSFTYCIVAQRKIFSNCTIQVLFTLFTATMQVVQDCVDLLSTLHSAISENFLDTFPHYSRFYCTYVPVLDAVVVVLLLLLGGWFVQETLDIAVL